MAEQSTYDGFGPTRDGFSSLDLLRDLRTPSMSAIGQNAEAAVFPSFSAITAPDRSQYLPQQASSYSEAQRMDNIDAGTSVPFDVVFDGPSSVLLVAGYVRSLNPASSADNPITDWMPAFEGTPLDAPEAPSIPVTAGSVIYCVVKTDNKGVVTETPSIVVASDGDTGTHYQPPQDSPVDGALRYPIASFAEEGGVLLATPLQRGGPLLVQPNLWEGENIGGYRELYKRRDNAGDRYQFRTLEQLLTEDATLNPVPVMRPLEESEGEGDSIPFRFLTEKPSSGSSGDEAQVKVLTTEDGAGIIVRGNSYDNQASGQFAASLDTKDGLVRAFEGIAFGLSTTIKISDPCATFLHVLVFSRGLLTDYYTEVISS
jgi:hypothetical protein